MASPRGAYASSATTAAAHIPHWIASRRGGEGLRLRDEKAKKNEPKTCRNGIAMSDTSGRSEDARPGS